MKNLNKLKELKEYRLKLVLELYPPGNHGLRYNLAKELILSLSPSWFVNQNGVDHESYV